MNIILFTPTKCHAPVGHKLRILLAFCVMFIMAVCATSVQASGWPTKPVKIIVGYPPGGGADTVARLLADALTKSTEQQFIVENRAGAGGTIGAHSVVRAAPDGYTLYLAASSEITLAPVALKTLPYNPEKDFAPIAVIGKWPYFLVTAPTFPANTVKELIDYVKQHPGQVSYASFGNNTINHLTGELFNLKAGLDSTHIPYKGSSPALVDLMGGQTQYTFDSPVATLNLIRSGKLKALAVTSTERLPNAKTIPTMAEAGVPLVSGAWMGLLAPAETPAAIIGKLNAEVIKALDSSELRNALASRDIQAGGGTPDELARQITTEIAEWRDIATQVGLKPN